MQTLSTRIDRLPFIVGSILIFLLLLAAPVSAADPQTQTPPAADPWTFLLDAETLFGYSDIAGPIEGDFSTSQKWLASAGYQMTEQAQLIGLYNGSFRKDNIFIRQDEGSQSSNQLLTHNLSAALKNEIGENLIFKPVFFYNTVFVKETADESIGDGLYDYEDLGGGFENTHLFEDAATGEQRRLTYGFNAFLREYPNYRTLEALATREAIEDKEKDFVGYKADLTWRAPWWWGTSGRLSGTALFKDYTDKRTIDFNGIREEDNRRDFYYEAGGSVGRAVTEILSVGFASAWKQNLSSLDFYDTRNTLTLTDDRFFEKYFNYHAYELAPSVTLIGPKFAASAEPSTVQAGWTFEKTFYPGRTAQDISGVLLGEDQTDRNARTSVQLTVPLNERWAWMLAGSYEKQTSNQKFENSFLYTYESWSVLSGVRFEL